MKNIIDTCLEIVEQHQYQHYKDVLIDATSAQLLLKVYEALNEQNKLSFIRLADKNIHRLVSFCWSQVSA